METTIARPLSQVTEGETVSVVSVEARQGLRGRLAAMGLLSKTRIRVVLNGKSGPFVVSVKNSRMALGRGVADKIMVR